MLMLFRRWCRGCDQTKLRAFISLDDERSGFINFSRRQAYHKFMIKLSLRFNSIRDKDV